MITFEYDGKIYSPSNLEKKLKKLKITINDIKILEDTSKKQIETIKEETYHQANKIALYIFYNTQNGHTIVSIYNNLDDLVNCINVKDWEYKGSTYNEITKSYETIEDTYKRLNISL